ncbi:MAG: ankyrin repeat domain-containing protein [Pigmentiphaga sp.]|nr:ankyrin repeat domain-containing protein [Pigmentiphaga sp.]
MLPRMRSVLSKLLAVLLLQASLPLFANTADDFWIAIRNDQANAVERFVSGKQSRINDRNDLSNTPLMEAIKNTSWRAYQVLLERSGLDVNAENLLGENALMYLAILGETDRMKVLIGKGAEVNKTGWTPLHYAASQGRDEALRLLIEHHAYLDAESPTHRLTPLMMAAQYGRRSSAMLLLEEGADGYVRNAKGQNAVEIAREAGNTVLANEIATFLNENRRQQKR